jgi:hypothetical protein
MARKLTWLDRAQFRSRVASHERLRKAEIQHSVLRCKIEAQSVQLVVRFATALDTRIDVTCIARTTHLYGVLSRQCMYIAQRRLLYQRSKSPSEGVRLGKNWRSDRGRAWTFRCYRRSFGIHGAWTLSSPPSFTTCCTMTSSLVEKASTSFTTRRVNRSTFAILEDDDWKEHPLIYVKVHPLVPLIILSDTGCDEPSKKHKKGTYLHPHSNPTPGSSVAYFALFHSATVHNPTTTTLFTCRCWRFELPD